jgi:hypothetical protein
MSSFIQRVWHFVLQLGILIADKELSLVMGLKNDTKETTNEALGLSMYSNSESTSQQ